MTRQFLTLRNHFQAEMKSQSFASFEWSLLFDKAIEHRDKKNAAEKDKSQ